MTTYKALTYKTWKSPLEWTDKEFKKLGETEVLVKIKAVSVNPVDCLLRRLMPTFIKASVVKTMGDDFSGVITEAGAKSGFKKGDPVYGAAFEPFGELGTFTEYIQVDPKKVFFFEKIPDGMTFEQAASLPTVAGTAYQALKEYKQSWDNANVLVLGAGTSVGRNAVTLAKNHFKANNVVATCSPKSAEAAKTAGADVVVDYTKGDTATKNGILEAVKDNGKFDIIVCAYFDYVSYSIFKTILKPAADGGVFSNVGGCNIHGYKTLGYTSVLPPGVLIVETIKETLRLSKFRTVDIKMYPDSKALPVLGKLWDQKKLPIVIDSEYDIETEYNEALDKVALGKATGKVVMKF